MKRFKVIAAAAVMALAASAGAQAQALEAIDETPSAAAMAFDLLLVRPLGLVATVGGVGLFVLQLPLSIVQGEPPLDPARKLIVEPARFTFDRPLGEMD